MQYTHAGSNEIRVMRRCNMVSKPFGFIRLLSNVQEFRHIRELEKFIAQDMWVSVFLDRASKDFQGPREPQIIAVYQRNVLTLRLPNADIACGTRSAIGLA